MNISAYSIKGCRVNVHFTSVKIRAVLTFLGALGPPGGWGPYHPYGTHGGWAVVLCTSESGNTHLGPNQGQT